MTVIITKRIAGKLPLLWVHCYPSSIVTWGKYQFTLAIHKLIGQMIQRIGRLLAILTSSINLPKGDRVLFRGLDLIRSIAPLVALLLQVTLLVQEQRYRSLFLLETVRSDCSGLNCHGVFDVPRHRVLVFYSSGKLNNWTFNRILNLNVKGYCSHGNCTYIDTSLTQWPNNW